MFDEPDAWTKVIRLSWHEAIGLKHAINEACDHPQFKLRDPKSQKNEVRFAEDTDYVHVPMDHNATRNTSPGI